MGNRVENGCGIQVSGFSNINRISVFRGIQIGCIVGNQCTNSYGLLIGGLTNLAGGNGIQISGLMNMSYFKGVDSFKGPIEVAGLVNVTAERYCGMQVSGILNSVCGSVEGGQIGTINFTYKLNGIQIGVINIFETLNGVQLGCVNIKDFIIFERCEGIVFGGQIGIINYTGIRGCSGWYY